MLKAPAYGAAALW